MNLGRKGTQTFRPECGPRWWAREQKRRLILQGGWHCWQTLDLDGFNATQTGAPKPALAWQGAAEVSFHNSESWALPQIYYTKAGSLGTELGHLDFFFFHFFKWLFLIEVKFTWHKINHFKVYHAVGLAYSWCYANTTSIYFQNIVIILSPPPKSPYPLKGNTISHFPLPPAPNNH